MAGTRFQLADEVGRARKLLECERCGLWYFSHVPSRATLVSLLWAGTDQPRWQGAGRPAWDRARREARWLRTDARVILDIGSHDGAFLRSVCDAYTKYALDPTPIDGAGGEPGLRVIKGFVDETELPKQTFDIVTAFDVLEHVHDPAEALSRVREGLVARGQLIVETGDNRARFARWLRGGWYYLNYLEHFQAFSARAMTVLLDRHGFKINSMVNTFHSSRNAGAMMREFIQASIFAGIAAGGRPRIWRTLNRLLRPGCNATPPATGLLERDHIFVVAIKV